MTKRFSTFNEFPLNFIYYPFDECRGNNYSQLNIKLLVDIKHSF